MLDQSDYTCFTKFILLEKKPYRKTSKKVFFVFTKVSLITYFSGTYETTQRSTFFMGCKNCITLALFTVLVEFITLDKVELVF